MKSLNRRQFMQLLAAASVSQMSWAADAIKPKANLNNGYKALICLQLLGGNDSWNLLIPTADESKVGRGHGYQTYHARRGELAIAQEAIALSPVNKPSAQVSGYTDGVFSINEKWGINSCAPELAWLTQMRQLDWVINTGVLAEPVNRSVLTTAQLPLFLYAHDHQQRALALADAQQQVRTGWAGRLAEYWRDRGLYQTANPLGLNIALERSSIIFNGSRNSELVLPAGRPIKIWGAGRPEFKDAMTRLNSVQSENPLINAIAARQKHAIDLAAYFDEQWGKTYDYSKLHDPFGSPLFSLPGEQEIGLDVAMQGNLLKQLETVARVIEIGQREELERQIFVVTMPGFDTHDDQHSRHHTLLRELSLSLWHFQQAMQHLGLQDNVSLFTQSDFGRTLVPNNSGTDHGWGGNQMIMGGAAKGQLYGTMPDLRENSESMDKDQRGRIIPAIASEQITAHMLQWLGVPAADLPQILPTIERFNDIIANEEIHKRM